MNFFYKVSFDTFLRDAVNHVQFDEEDDDFIPKMRAAYEAIPIPARKTACSAGYDFVTPFFIRLRPGESIMFPTGIKARMNNFNVLFLFVRSSIGLKKHCMIPNSVGVIDADYFDNPDNEGEIFFQMINLSPYDIQLHKGDIIGQGIIKPYLTTEDDVAVGERKGGFGSTSV